MKRLSTVLAIIVSLIFVGNEAQAQQNQKADIEKLIKRI
jgi:hypothetical protein